jgi:hypothetical protein
MQAWGTGIGNTYSLRETRCGVYGVATHLWTWTGNTTSVLYECKEPLPPVLEYAHVCACLGESSSVLS